MIRTSAPRQVGDQIRGELRRVQVPAAILMRMVGEAAGTPTFRAGHPGSDMGEPVLVSSLFNLEINRFDPPRFIRAEQSRIVFRKCFHPGNPRHR